MADEIAVRRANADDAEDVGRLLHDFNREFDEATPGPDFLARRLSGLIASGEAVVLLAGAGPDGLAVLRSRPDLWSAGTVAYLEELYVVPELRGRGIGRALLDATVEAARRSRATRVEVGTDEGDTAARGLYESSGFTNRADGELMFFYELEL
ncbi:MAG TPA: GNAT family N-acetyltransferase [Solirubrobacterales bacterium]|nr:GNAT family N-acetyltransferase [Solirubrobacterales bacterium]